MDLRDRLRELLVKSAEAIECAIYIIPADRLIEDPPNGLHPNSDKGFKTYFGDWSAARLLFHLVFYEEPYALPAMMHWIREPHPTLDLILPDPSIEEEAWERAMHDRFDLEDWLRSFPIDQVKTDRCAGANPFG